MLWEADDDHTGALDVQDLVEVTNRISFAMPFILKVIILPRQARDKHRESTQKKCRFPSVVGLEEHFEEEGTDR